MTETYRIVHWEKETALTEEEAEALLNTEGYDSFRWHDVPGSSYPIHRHLCDECIWVLKGEIRFTIDGKEIVLKAGDRLYLPSRLPHQAYVPDDNSVTYLVGQKSSKK